MTSFKGVHFPKEAILYAVYFYLRYGFFTAIWKRSWLNEVWK